MELSEQLRRRGLQLRLNWIPREGNQPADDLTNEVYDRFDESLRVQASWSTLKFNVLSDLMKEGLQYMDECAANRRAKRAADTGGPAPKARRGDALRDRDPW